MSNMDWVPCLNFGATVTLTSAGVPSGADLLMSSDIDADVVGKIEDTDDLFCHRIVGDVWIDVSAGNVGQDLFWGIMPLQEDIDNQVAQLPWDETTYIFTASMSANLRFWDMRNLRLLSASWSNSVTSPATVTPLNPWYFHVDITPKQKFGGRLNLWPAFVGSVSVGANPNPVIRYTPYLRLLCSGR